MQTLKRTLALFVALAMCASVMCVSAFADDGEGEASEPTLEQRVDQAESAAAAAVAEAKTALEVTDDAIGAAKDAEDTALSEQTAQAGIDAAAAVEGKTAESDLAGLKALLNDAAQTTEDAAKEAKEAADTAKQAADDLKKNTAAIAEGGATALNEQVGETDAAKLDASEADVTAGETVKAAAAAVVEAANAAAESAETAAKEANEAADAAEAENVSAGDELITAAREAADNAEDKADKAREAAKVVEAVVSGAETDVEQATAAVVAAASAASEAAQAASEAAEAVKAASDAISTYESAETSDEAKAEAASTIPALVKTAVEKSAIAEAKAEYAKLAAEKAKSASLTPTERVAAVKEAAIAAVDATKAAIEARAAAVAATSAVRAAKYVAQNTRTGLKYSKLETAVAEASAGDEIKLLDSVTLGETLEIGKSLTLDLNGKTISNSFATTGANTDPKLIQVKGGGLTIKDSGTTGKVQTTGRYAVFVDSGTFTLKSGTITSPTYTIQSKGTVNIEGGAVRGTGGAYEYTILNAVNAAVLNISDGTVSSKGYFCVYNLGSGAVNISGNAGVSASYYAVYNAAGGKVQVTGGEVTAENCWTIFNKAGGSVQITGGKVTASNQQTIYNGGVGSVTVGGSAEVEAPAITLNNVAGGTITVEGNAKVKATNDQAIYNASDGKVCVRGNAEIKASVTAVRNVTGTVEITGGSLIAEDSTIYNDIGAGTVEIGNATVKVEKVSDEEKFPAAIWIMAGTTLTLKSGAKVIGTGTGDRVYPQGILVDGATTSSGANTTVTVERGAKIEAPYSSIYVQEKQGSGNYCYGVTVNVSGELKGTLFVSGNIGNNTTSAAKITEDLENRINAAPIINIHSGASVTDSSVAVQMGGYSRVNVAGSVTGGTAVAIKRGILTVEDGASLHATGAKIDPTRANGNGAENTGAAVSTTSTYNYSGPVDVTVNGGTLTSDHYAALLVSHSNEVITVDGVKQLKLVDGNPVPKAFNNVSVKIDGGNFTGAAGEKAVAVDAKIEGVDGDGYRVSEFITGGTFNTDPSAYVADDHAAFHYNGSYVVSNDSPGTPAAPRGMNTFRGWQPADGGDLVTLPWSGEAPEKALEPSWTYVSYGSDSDSSSSTTTQQQTETVEIEEEATPLAELPDDLSEITVVVNGEEVAVSELPTSYVDVEEDSWARDAIAYVSTLDIMGGVGDDRFAPTDGTTRGMVATVLMRLDNGEPIDLDSFVDVEDDAYYAEAAAWSVENGVFVGYEDGTFRGDIVITREQFAATLYRYAESKGFDVAASDDLLRFSDADRLSGYARSAMEWAVAVGLIKGTADDKLSPDDEVTREQIALILMRFNEMTKAVI